VKEIPLTQGYVAVVDDEDYERVAQRRWHVRFTNTGRHAKDAHLTSNTCKETLGMCVLNYPFGVVCRLNTGDKPFLDYRKTNLVIWPNYSLAIHRNGPRTAGSGYMGVSVQRGHVRAKCGRQYLGTFPTTLDAAFAYDKAAFARYGQYAILNFPEEVAK
jgi:hypothetical protein